jgi:lipoprotein-releasing system permease protein
VPRNVIPSFELSVAMKHITSRKRQTFLSVAAVGLAVGISIVFISIQNGFFEFLFDIIFKNLSYITISPEEGEEYLHLYRNMVDNIWAIGGVTAVSPVLGTTATFAYEDNVENVAMLGVIPSEADKISSINEEMVYGDLNSVLGGKRVVMGQALADKLELKRGDTVEVSFPDAKTLNLVVAGIFDTGYAQVDEAITYVSLETAREFLGEGDVITSIDIKLEDVYQADAVTRELTSYGYNAKSWQELYPDIVRTLALERAQNLITMLLILVIATFGIANVMNMLVLEKTREIGMLMAAGAQSSQIRRIFLIESGLLGLIGAIFGCTLGLVVSLYLGTLVVPAGPTGEMINLPVLLDPQDFITFTLIALALSLIAGVYPAHKASRLDPVEALRG